jgi:hypothetical protein
LEAARLTSILGQAENDAGIAVWDVKYQDALWRPITAIRDCANWSPNFTACDPTWNSLIATPPHPDYLAGHPGFSGAAAKILANFFGRDAIPFSSTSDAYCNTNGSTALRGGAGQLILGCLVPPTSTFAFAGGNTIYSTPTGCKDAGGIPDKDENPTTCTINGVTYRYNPNHPGCNDVVNGGANDSAYICPITETFAGLSDAAVSAELSRIAGGIHTSFAVTDALALGSQIGQILADENNIPEPGTIALLATSFGLLGGLRRFRSARHGRRAGRNRGASTARYQ